MMRSSYQGTGCRRFTRFVADALMGRLGITAMVVGYSACAVVLLAYVSTKVYTYSLMEDVSACERKQRALKERVGLLTERYADLSAMDRVSEICEKRLGMVSADEGRLVRVAVDSDWRGEGGECGFEDEGSRLPGMADLSIDEITEVIRK